MDHKTEKALREELVALLPRLRRFALGLTGQGAEADDLLQAALEKALGRLEQFKPGSRLDSWMFRIIQTTWIDARRKAGRQEELMEMDDLARISDGSQPDETPLVERQAVLQALGHLTEEQRSLIMLVLVEGYSYKEAAEALDLPIGTVMSRLSRARQYLMSLLSSGTDATSDTDATTPSPDVSSPGGEERL